MRDVFIIEPCKSVWGFTLARSSHLSFMFKDEERGILVLELGFCLKRDFKHALLRYCLSLKYAVYGSQINPVPDFLAFPPN